jgi:hypothetical protein
MVPVQDAPSASISTDRSERVFMTAIPSTSSPYGRHDPQIDLKKHNQRPFGTAFEIATSASVDSARPAHDHPRANSNRDRVTLPH